MLQKFTASAAIVAALVFTVPAQAGVIGKSFTVTSESTFGNQTTASITAIDPGAEIEFGDANALNWMVTGDSIDFLPSGNPNASNQLQINFGSSHSFTASDELVLTFNFGNGIVLTGVGAITAAITVTDFQVALLPHSIVVTIGNMVEVSQDDFGGSFTLKFQTQDTVPAPGALALFGLGLIGFAGFRRRAA